MAEPLSLFLGRRFFASGSRSRLASFISLQAMAGLVLGVAMLIIVLAVMNGFEREMRTKILAVVPHIELYRQGGIEHWPTLSKQVEAHPQVLQATPFSRLRGMVNHRGRIQAVQLLGVHPDHMDDALAQNLPSEAPRWLADGQLLLSQTLADKLGAKPGDRLAVIAPRQGGDARAPAMAVMPLGGVFSTHTAEDNVLAVAPLARVAGLRGADTQVEGLRLRVQDVFGARQIGLTLLRDLPGGFTFTHWRQTHGNLYQAIQMSRQMVGLLVFLVIAIAVFNVVSMLVMTVVDKRPAIAVLKTLGAGNGDVLRAFLVQGGLIGVLGSALGVLLGVAGAWGVSPLVAAVEGLLGIQFLDAAIYPIDYIPSDLRAADVLAVAGTALALNFLATLYPAWRAAQTRPAEILRYE